MLGENGVSSFGGGKINVEDAICDIVDGNSVIVDSKIDIKFDGSRIEDGGLISTMRGSMPNLSSAMREFANLMSNLPSATPMPLRVRTPATTPRYGTRDQPARGFFGSNPGAV